MANPCPTPIQIAATPQRSRRSRNTPVSVPRMRVPDAPSGCPMAIAPPRVLTMSGSSFQASRQTSDWTANASLSSTAPTSSQPIPAAASARLAASTGAYPKSCGASAWVPRPAIRATGSAPIIVAADSDPSSTAEAPSVSGDALPAVIVPSGRNAGLSPASVSGVDPGRMPSSRASSAPGTGTANWS